MAKNKKTAIKATNSDSAYVLKLILYIMISSQWLRITKGAQWQVPIPYGAFVALFFAMHEHFKIDRKIEYAVILVAMLVGFWVPGGITLLFA